MPPARPSLSVPLLLALALALPACRDEIGLGERAGGPASPLSRPVATLGPDDAVPEAGSPIEPVAMMPVPGRFDPAAVAESRARLPPFPLLAAPPGLAGLNEPAQRDIARDREHMIAGDAVVALDGRVFRQRYRLGDDGAGTGVGVAAFQRHYADAIRALGGVEVSRVQFSPQVNAAFGGRAAVETHYHGACASHACENHTYLVRQGRREYWALVSSGGEPPHGQVTVVEVAAGP